MHLEYQESYVEPNATATDGGVDLSSSILINGSVNENQLGTYNIIYSVTDSDGNSVTETRVVNVVDTTKPEITLLGSVSETIEVDTSFTDAGYAVSDNYDSSLTVTVSGAVDTSTLGTYTIDYQTTDSQGNVADVKTRTLTVVDTQEPVMSLIGDLSQTIQVKSSYTEQGVSAIDNYDVLSIQRFPFHIYFSSLSSLSFNSYSLYCREYDTKLFTSSFCDLSIRSLSACLGFSAGSTSHYFSLDNKLRIVAVAMPNNCSVLCPKFGHFAGELHL